MSQSFFVTASAGFEPLLEQELRELGIASATYRRGGVGFTGSMADAVRVCLWSRIANRVLLLLTEFDLKSPDDLYTVAREFSWETYLDSDGTLLVDVAGRSRAVAHTRFAAQRVKDGVVDRFVAIAGRRPSVEREQPDLRINLHLQGERAHLALDVSGDSLHRRGYRTEAGEAPLKENLAAALLLRAGWPEMAAAGKSLVDPCCGSGTFLIEGAMIARNQAPGLLRTQFGAERWRNAEPEIWGTARDEARSAARNSSCTFAGSDIDRRVIGIARDNARRAGFAELIQLETAPVAALQPRNGLTPGLVICNPPYGERLRPDDLTGFYLQLGETLARNFPGWRAAMLAGSDDLGYATGLRAERRNPVRNGPLESIFLQFDLTGQAERQQARREKQETTNSAFNNRLKKNAAHWGRWARREGVECYRVYDADLPEFALAVDRYGDWVHVSEYAPPGTVDASAADRRRRAALAAIPEVLQIDQSQLFFKERSRQRGEQQYGRLDRAGDLRAVHEGGLRFLVNPTDYLDTGLFLDHRQTRALVRDLAPGRRFLNLFAYTGSVTVYAASGGARSSLTIDMSQTYLDWAQRNLELNRLAAAQHRFLRADCLQWLEQKADEEFDLIFVDPPTFSNSKRMEATWDVQRDYLGMLEACWRRLASGGTLIFSTNRRKFQFAEEEVARICPGARIAEITRQTLPADFQRRPAHRCWRLDRA